MSRGLCIINKFGFAGRTGSQHVRGAQQGGTAPVIVGFAAEVRLA